MIYLLQSLFRPRNLLIGGGVIGALTATLFFLSISPQAILTLAAGALGVSVLVLGVLLYLRWRLRRFYGEGDASLMQVIRGRPGGVSDPEQVARLDQFSRKFEEGCKKYVEATGLAVSESPWYLLVGESGSGKTEAIRHCGVEFPEGLHEERQGAGGTTNMDWWFTEQAILLDTAGRFAIDPNGPRSSSKALANSDTDDEDDDDDAGSDREKQARQSTQREWELFLQSVVKARPHCPVNGLVLVIPATSLLRDTPEQINAKGEELARFLNGIRQSLTVRFPVFVLITKSDLIPGFREFFGHVTDVELSQQMLGWSKSGSLDEPFDPEEIDAYLEQVKERLERRRLSLVMDPVHSQLPGARRIEQVDTLYTFPQRFSELGPQLRRYLGKMFVRSKFNQAPLFLRGIYFTSSMEHGAAIDAALASLRGVTLKQLERQGVGYRRDRAVFLRDVFMGKVFAESGLVTREVKTDHLRRRRSILTMGVGIGAAMILLLCTFAGYYAIVRNVELASARWRDFGASYASHPAKVDFFAPIDRAKPLAVPAMQWDAKNSAPDNATLAAFFKQQTDAAAKIRTPWIYAPLTLFSDVNGEREKAIAALMQRHLVINALDTVDTRVRAIEEAVSHNESDDLATAALQKDSPLVTTALQLRKIADGPPSRGKADSPTLNSAIDFAVQPLKLGAPVGGQTIELAEQYLNPVPPTTALALKESAAARANHIAKTVGDFWERRLLIAPDERRSAEMGKLKASLKRWQDSYQRIVSLAREQPIDRESEYRESSRAIAAQMTDLASAATDANAAWNSLREQSGATDVDGMLKWLADQLEKEKASALDALGQVKPAAAAQDRFTSLEKSIGARSFKLADMLNSPDFAGLVIVQRLGRGVTTSGKRVLPFFDVMTQQVAAVTRDASTSVPSIAVALTSINDAESQSREQLDSLTWATPNVLNPQEAPPGNSTEAQRLKLLQSNVLAPGRRYLAVRDWLAKAPRTLAEFKTSVRGDAGAPATALIVVPLAVDAPAQPNGKVSGSEQLADFNADVAGARFQDWSSVRRAIAAGPTTAPSSPADAKPILDRAALASDAERVQKAAADYGQQYVDFWYGHRPQAATWTAWSDLHAAMVNTNADELRSRIEARVKQCSEAIDKLRPNLDANGAAAAGEKLGALATMHVTPEAHDAYKQWEALDAAAVDALSTLTAQEPDKMYATYLLPVVSQNESLQRRVFLSAIDLIAKEGESARNDNIDKLNKEWLQRFPFAASLPVKPKNVLTRAELARAKTALDKALKTAALPTAQAAPAKEFGTLAQGDPAMQAALRRLFKATYELERLRGAQTLANVLTDPKVTCELALAEAPKEASNVAGFKSGEPLATAYVEVDKAKVRFYTIRNLEEPVQIAASKFATKEFGKEKPAENVKTWGILQKLATSAPGTKWPKDGSGTIIVEIFNPGGNSVILKVKVIFKRDNVPIDFVYPLPDDASPAPAAPAAPPAGAP